MCSQDPIRPCPVEPIVFLKNKLNKNIIFIISNKIALTHITHLFNVNVEINDNYKYDIQHIKYL